MNPEKAQLITKYLEQGKAATAKKIFDETAYENTEEYWLLKGKIEQKFQHWGDAINAYSKVLELNNDNPEAKNNIHIIQNILNFWSPEMFNP